MTLSNETLEMDLLKALKALIDNAVEEKVESAVEEAVKWMDIPDRDDIEKMVETAVEGNVPDMNEYVSSKDFENLEVDVEYSTSVAEEAKDAADEAVSEVGGLKDALSRHADALEELLYNTWSARWGRFADSAVRRWERLVVKPYNRAANYVKFRKN